MINFPAGLHKFSSCYKCTKYKTRKLTKSASLLYSHDTYMYLQLSKSEIISEVKKILPPPFFFSEK